MSLLAAVKQREYLCILMKGAVILIQNDQSLFLVSPSIILMEESAEIA